MKNKKIISLISALAMIFSMFSAFTVANAEVTKGLALAGTLSEDGKTLTIEADAKGMDSALLSFGIKFAVPEGVTDAAKITYTAGAASGTWTPTLVNGIYTLSFFNMSPVEFTNGKLATIKIALDTELKADYELKLDSTAMIQDTTNGKLAVSTGMSDSAVTVPKWQDPNKKPPTEERPGKEEEPEQPDVPTPVPAGDKGIDLVATLNSDNTILTIDATAKGMDSALLSFGIKFAAPEGVTDPAKITYTAGAASGTWTPTLVNGVYTLSFFNMSPVEFTDGKLATIVIELPAPATAPIAVTLDSTAMIQDTTNGKLAVSTGAMAATSAVAMPSEDKPAPVNTVDLVGYVDPKYEAAIAAVPAGKAVYMTVSVKLDDGTDAVYGRDFTAVYNGVELSEAAFKNLIHGYTEPDMVKVIQGLKFNIYSKNVKKISTTLNAEGEEEQLTQPVDKEINPSKPTDEKFAKLTVTASKKTVTAGDGTKVKVTTKITNPGEDGVLTVRTDADSLDFVTGSGIKIIAADAEDGEYTAVTTSAEELGLADTVEFVGAAKGKINLYYEYSYKTDRGNADKVTGEVTVTVTAPKTGGGSGSDSSGKGGAIAAGTNGITAANGAINFVDLDTVTWAQDAILRLVDKKVINGRSNTIFDPNGTVTRAEFAKMVVLGFNLTGGAPGNFSDVDASAWYNNYVQIGYANDVISGYDDGTFRPNGLISRQEMAAMISRAVKAANKNLPATVAAVDFSDVNPTTEWGYAEISALQTAGVINGMTATTFEPYSNATRAQAAVIIDRAMTNAR